MVNSLLRFVADVALRVCPILVDGVMVVCSGGKGLVLYSTNYYYYYYYYYYYCNDDWLKIFSPIFQPMRSKTKFDRTLYARFLPRFDQVKGNC